MLIKKLDFTKGPLYLIVLIWLIKLAKIIFISEIKQGREIRIPDELTLKFHENEQQLELPQSLRFYDTTFSIIKGEINED